MNRLPDEIQIDIFSRLSFKDKLQCALACRNWYTKISNTILYATVSFSNHQCDHQTAEKIRYLYYKGLGKQIKNLIIAYINDLLELSELCPNLKSLQVDQWCLCDEWNGCIIPIARNWKKLEVISENGYRLTMKLLEAPSYMKSLTSLTLNLQYLSERKILQFIDQLKHIPTIEHLCLTEVLNLTSNKLDELHENTPNLKHLDLTLGDYLFGEEGDTTKEYRPLSVGTSVANNLHSLKITFDSSDFEDWEISCLYCVEYVCRKYPNLISITVCNIGILLSQYYKDITAEHVQKALGNWIRLKKFYMRPVYLSTSILEAMDNFNIHLEELGVYVNDNEEYREQLISLAHSKQGKLIRKLAIEDGSHEHWSQQQYLAYFLKSLDKNNCHLKEIDTHLNVIVKVSTYNSNVLSPCQVLEFVPSLQRLSMPLSETRITYFQTTNLTQLALKLEDLDNNDTILKYNTQQHIQYLIYASPSLQSFSLDSISSVYGITLDFQRNAKLKRVKNRTSKGDIIKIIQNRRTKCYTYCTSENNPRKQVFEKTSSRKDDNACRIILQLPLNLRSLILCDYELSL